MEENKDKVEGSNDSKQQEGTISKEEHERIIKDLQSNSDKGVQKILGEKKHYERVLEVLPEVGEDNNYLIKLHDDEPQVAEIILNKYHGGKTIEEYKDYIGYEVDYTDPKEIEAMVEKMANKKEQQRAVNGRKKEIYDQLGWDEEKTKKLDEEFSDITAGKNISQENLDKYLFMAIREVDDGVDLKSINRSELTAKVNMIGSGGSGGSKSSKKVVNNRIETIKEQNIKFLKEQNII